MYGKSMVCSNIPWRSTKSSSEASHLRYRVLNEISPVLSKRHRGEERGHETNFDIGEEKDYCCTVVKHKATTNQVYLHLKSLTADKM